MEVVFHLKNFNELLGKLRSNYRRSVLGLVRRRQIFPEEDLICLCHKICNRTKFQFRHNCFKIRFYVEATDIGP